jgi:hypothetical protein
MNPMPQKFIVSVFVRAVEERRPVRKEEGIDGDEGEKWERGRGGGGGTEKDGGRKQRRDTCSGGQVTFIK